MRWVFACLKIFYQRTEGVLRYYNRIPFSTDIRVTSKDTFTVLDVGPSVGLRNDLSIAVESPEEPLVRVRGGWTRTLVSVTNEIALHPLPPHFR